jgi:hypothetical protein
VHDTMTAQKRDYRKVGEVFFKEMIMKLKYKE